MIARVLTFVRFSHTVFAMPFALGAMFVAADGWPGLRVCVFIVIAMVFARTAAMAFNRIVDWQIDKRNPRTSGRHKLISFPSAVALCAGSAAGFLGATYFINLVCFVLSPVALVLIFFYSLTKRFTALCHFFLGIALAIAPVGAWLAVTGRFDLPPFLLATAVVLWVAGFDLIYAAQDYEFDKQEGLHSMIVRLGISRSLRLAQLMHGIMWFFLAAFGVSAGLGAIYWTGLALMIPALAYEHYTARSLDVAAINRAFFCSNAVVGFVFVLACAVDRLWVN